MHFLCQIVRPWTWSMQPVPRLEVAFNEYSPPALESPGLIKRTLRLRLGQLHFIAEPCSKSCATVNDVSNSDILTFTDSRFGITSLHQHKWLGPGNKNKEQDNQLKRFSCRCWCWHDTKVTWEELEPCCFSSVGGGDPICKKESTQLCQNLQEVKCALKAVKECRWWGGGWRNWF